MTGTKSKFWSKFRFRLYSVPATGRNFAGISNLGKDCLDFLRLRLNTISGKDVTKVFCFIGTPKAFAGINL
jgi:hypothetical protein